MLLMAMLVMVVVVKEMRWSWMMGGRNDSLSVVSVTVSGRESGKRGGVFFLGGGVRKWRV